MRGWLHAWEPRCKVAALLGAAGGVAFLHHWYAALLAFALAALLAGVSRLSLRFVVAYLSILTLAAIPFVLILPWTLRDGRPAWVEWGPLTFHPYGLETGLAVGLRLAAIGLLALTLFGTTPWSELLAALHRLGLPAALVWIVALARQYAELLGREFQRLRAALRVRGFRPRPTWHGYRHLGYACGALLVHGAERAERVAAAMRCRGFQGRFIALTPPRPCRLRDLLACVLLWLIVLCLALWERQILEGG